MFNSVVHESRGLHTRGPGLRSGTSVCAPSLAGSEFSGAVPGDLGWWAEILFFRGPCLYSARGNAQITALQCARWQSTGYLPMPKSELRSTHIERISIFVHTVHMSPRAWVQIVTIDPYRRDEESVSRLCHVHPEQGVDLECVIFFCTCER